MAYSLKNIGDRVAALEAKKYSTWTKGSNTNGYWVKESTTGLIIQWGKTGSITAHNGTITFPIAYTSVPVVYSLGLGDRTAGTDDGSPAIRAISTTNCRTTTGTTSITVRVWIAIGYLISDRILNYIYIAIFVHIFLIFSRFLQS